MTSSLITYLGLDIGTSAVKAVLIDPARRALAEATIPLGISRPQSSWSEHSAEDWWAATESAVADLKRQAPAEFARIGAIGLSGQMHGAVLLGRDDQPLRPVILWNDGRAAGEAAELQARFPNLAERLGVLPMAGLTAPKLLWLARNEPECFAVIDALMLPKDYIRLKLTGERASDMSDAAGSWLFDQAERRWSRAAADAIGLNLNVLPRLVEGNAVSGRLRRSLAETWGLRSDVIVAGGGGDAAVGAIGIGAIEAGASFISLGTSAQLTRIGDRYRPNVPRLVHAFAHAVPDRWYQMGAMLNGASAFGFTAGLLGREVGALAAEAAAAFRGPSSLIALPYLTGERTPHNDPNARGVIFGLDAATRPVDVAQAMLEAIAFTLADAAAALGPAPDDHAAIGLIGGGARSDLWMRIIAAVLDRPIVRYAGGDKGPAYGAALLARMALTGEAPQDVATPPAIADGVEPDRDLVEAYQPRLEKFRALYRAVCGLF